MKLIVNGRDLSFLIAKIIHSGDDKNVSRKLEFELPYSDSDYFLKKLDIIINAGDVVDLYDDKDKKLFKGVIIDIKHSLSNNIISYTAFDFMFYVNNSDISKIYDDYAENIVSDVASILGIKTGHIEKTKVKVYLPALGESAYKVIMSAYTYVSRQNGKKYMPYMVDDKLSVFMKGLDSYVVLDGDKNLIDVSYCMSLSKLVNKVLVINKTGKVLNITKEDSLISKYGVVQKVVKDDLSKAKSLIKGLDKTITIKALGDNRAVAGKSLLYKDKIHNVVSKFYISSDNHTFDSKGHTMELKLEFENIMDEKEICAK